MFNKEKTIEYYDEAAGSYDQKFYERSEDNYAPNLFRLEIIKSILEGLPTGKIMDAGCGSGQLMVHMVKNGYDCIGVDFSPGMVEQTRNTLKTITDKEIPLIHASIDDLPMIEDASIDHIFGLGIFPFIPLEQEEGCFKELRRIIKPGGTLVTAHENELFDLLTFNKYTLRFFENNVFPLLDEVENGLDHEAIKGELATLVTNPDKPFNVDPGKSTRDIIFTKPENPVTFPEKLAKCGFAHQENRYYHFHALPPLIRNNNKRYMDISKKMEINFSRRWQGMFIASTFINISKAV